MTTSDWIAIISIAAGLFTAIVGSTLIITFKLGGINQRILIIEKTLDRLIEQTLPAMSARIDALTESIHGIKIELKEFQVKLDVLWKHCFADSHSPITLNEAGLKILAKTDIGDFVAEHYNEIFSTVNSMKPDNAYQAQELLISVVGRYKYADEHRRKLQNMAYVGGYDIDSMLFAGSLSIRDRVVSELGF